MSDTALSFYRKKYAGYSDKLKKLKRTQRIFVFLRLASFLLMIFLPLVFINSEPLIALFVFAPLMAVFLFLVKRYIAMDKQVEYYSGLIGINLNEIEAMRGNLTSFDEGRVFSDAGHQYSLDLDLFGPDSLFQYINRCSTFPGKKTLSEMLLEPAGSADVIGRRQKAFSELSGKPDFCQHFIASGRIHSDGPGDWTHLIEYVNSPSRFTRNYQLLLASKILPGLTLALLILAIAGIFSFSLFTVMFILQLGITGMMIRRINEIHTKVVGKLSSLKKCSNLLYIIQNAEFDAPLLKSLQRYLRSNGLPPSEYINKLSKIVDALDNRLNFIAAILLNGLLLWDINCVLLLEKWNRQHRKKLPVWMESIARMDAYVSFGIFTFNNDDFVFPQIADDGPVMQAVALGHPLIPRGERICNDFSIGDGSYAIITGANMAGKSTFLRTAGVALILANAGAPVCAGMFRFRILEIYTSMRTSDSLSRNESYFYAELKRLKDLIDKLISGKKVFVILDEILKGTNSTDKQKGSIALIKKMLTLESTGIVATHDLSLTSLERVFPGKIINKCFEVQIEGDAINFDYRLRDGVTSKMNALILMKQMGLLPDDPPVIN